MNLRLSHLSLINIYRSNLVLNPHYLMTQVIPLAVSSVLLVDLVLTASEMFKLMAFCCCIMWMFFFQRQRWCVLSFSETSLVTCDLGRCEMGQDQWILWIREVGEAALSLVLHHWSHWQRPCWPNFVKNTKRSKENFTGSEDTFRLHINLLNDVIYV